MKIYTVIPFYSTGDVYLNEVKSFKSFYEAQDYAQNNISNKIYEIVENILD